MSHEISDVTKKAYRNNVQMCEKWAGHELTTQNINDALLNQALVKMQEAGRAPDYIRSMRSAVIAIWRDAADTGLCDYPKRIRKIRSRIVRPQIWTAEHVGKLFIAAGQLKGVFRTMPLSRAKYFQTLIMIAWDSGLRRKDLHRLTGNDIQLEFVVEQHKTQKPVRVRLRPETIQAIRSWQRPPTDVLWPMWASDHAFQHTWRKVVVAAGVPYGPFKRVRKSAGTAAEEVQPGAGHYLLGNSRAVFERHYLDPIQIETPQPPALTT